jgi:hypothetical protein
VAGFVSIIARIGDKRLCWNLYAPVLPALVSRPSQCIATPALKMSLIPRLAMKAFFISPVAGL